MTPRDVIEGYLDECFGHSTRMDQIGLYAAELQDALAAAGFAVVPVEPTEAMIKIGRKDLGKRWTMPQKNIVAGMWNAMLAASKEPA